MPSFKKSSNPEQFCILSSNYFKIVMESASAWDTLPYHNRKHRPAWYRKNLLALKTRGRIVSGFKLDCTKKLTENKLLNFFNEVPIQTSLFIPNDLYHTITTEVKSMGCIVKATGYRDVNIWCKEDKKLVTSFCISVSSLIKELDEKELRQIEAIYAMVGYNY